MLNEYKRAGRTGVLVARPAGLGGVANFYDELMPYLPDDFRYCLIHNPGSKSIVAKMARFPAILFRFVRAIQGVKVVCLNPSLDTKAYYRDMIFLILSKALGRSVVVFFRGWDESLERKIKQSPFLFHVFSRTYGQVDGYIVLGEIFRQKLLALHVKRKDNIHKITTVASGMVPSLHDIEIKIQTLKNEVHCLFLARLVPGKGLDEAIAIYAELKKRLPTKRVMLTIAGDGPEKNRIQSLIKDMGLYDVYFPGDIRGRKKSNIMKNAHVFLFPSYTEGLPNVILEAMLHGLVIASTPVGAIPCLLRDNENGVLFRRNETDKAVEFLCRTINNPAAMRRIALMNWKTAKENFLPEKVAQRFVQIIARFRS